MKYRVETEEEDGWTRWIQPHHAGYKLMCCDCGLVHGMEFRVVKDDPEETMVDTEKQVKGLVIFRARRDERATAAARRKKSKAAGKAAAAAKTAKKKSKGQNPRGGKGGR